MAATEASMLEVQQVTKSYRGIPAVRGVTVSAQRGQVIGLLGPNGSGKSTTVKMLVGLLRPTSGTVRWCGVNIHDQLRDYQRRFGYVPEEPRLYAYLTAIEYLELVGGLRGIPSLVLRARIDRYLDLFGLGREQHVPLSAFSKGMRQKVLLAAALLHDPQIVMLDEPCSGLDVASTLILRRMVGALAARGTTVIYSSHVMDMVEKVCDDVLILHKGVVVAHDSVQRLRDLASAASLEEVFAALAVDQDVNRIGDELAQVAAS
jgi:ABC-2 type transport system ATP-binding protein